MVVVFALLLSHLSRAVSSFVSHVDDRRCAQSNSEAPKVPKHLEAARELLGNVKLEDTSYKHGPPSVLWKGSDGATSYECHTDCSGLIDALLTRSYGYDRDRFKKWLGKARPTADCYHDRIVEEAGFTNITNLKDAQPGDILAVKYLPRRENTGHVMLLDGTPKKMAPAKTIIDKTEQWEVPIIDSTMSAHGPTDSRFGKGPDGKDQDGLGQGTLRIYTREDGTIAGFSWSTQPASRFNKPDDEHIAIGRLKLEEKK